MLYIPKSTGILYTYDNRYLFFDFRDLPTKTDCPVWRFALLELGPIGKDDMYIVETAYSLLLEISYRMKIW